MVTLTRFRLRGRTYTLRADPIPKLANSIIACGSRRPPAIGLTLLISIIPDNHPMFDEAFPDLGFYSMGHSELLKMSSIDNKWHWWSPELSAAEVCRTG